MWYDNPPVTETDDVSENIEACIVGESGQHWHHCFSYSPNNLQTFAVTEGMCMGVNHGGTSPQEFGVGWEMLMQIVPTDFVMFQNLQHQIACIF